MKNTYFTSPFGRVAMLWVVLFLTVSAAWAVTYPSQPQMQNSNQPRHKFVQVGSMQGSGSLYASSVFTPFSEELPSEMENQDDEHHGPRIRRDFIIGPDTDPANASPVGEPLVLGVFAAAFAALILYRRRKNNNHLSA